MNNKIDKFKTVFIGLIPLIIVLLSVTGIIGDYQVNVIILSGILSIIIIIWLLLTKKKNIITYLLILENIIIVLIPAIIIFSLINTNNSPGHSVKCANAICEKCEKKGNKTICTDCINPADDTKIDGKCIYSGGD